MKKVDKSSSAGTDVDSSTNADVYSVNQPIAKPFVGCCTSIRERLLCLHEQEDGMNKELSLIDKQIKELNKKKHKISKRISKNMQFRNKLINQL